MKPVYLALAVSLLSMATLSHAQPVVSAPVAAPQSVAEEPTPDRLAASRQLIETLYPASEREAFFESMIAPMMENMVKGLRANPEITKAFETLPESRPIFDRYIADVRAISMQNMKDSLPAQMDAFTRAYARQFSVEQLQELTRFFSTPTGRAYLVKVPAVVNDPDVAKLQRESMQSSFARLQPRMEQMIDELSALRASLTKGKKK